MKSYGACLKMKPLHLLFLSFLPLAKKGQNIFATLQFLTTFFAYKLGITPHYQDQDAFWKNLSELICDLHKKKKILNDKSFYWPLNVLHNLGSKVLIFMYHNIFRITELSLRAGGWGFSPATKKVTPGYFYWKKEEK